MKTSPALVARPVGGTRLAKQRQAHRLLQNHLPTQLRQLGWQLFRWQNYWLAWHLPSLARTIGHSDLPSLIAEINEWNIFLCLAPTGTERPADLHRRYTEYSAGRTFALPTQQGLTPYANYTPPS